MKKLIETLFYLGPLLFGIGFIAPLVMQLITYAGWDLPFGLTPLIAGLITGISWGGYAQLRGRWA